MILDFGDGFSLRKATADDHAALKNICLRTGDSGNDATGREDDPDLIGLIYAVPYQVLEPEFAFTIDGPEGPAGYLLGTPDTSAFNARLAADWYPQLQMRIADAGCDRSAWRGSDWARHAVHHPNLSMPDALLNYPSHGHIDLLPQARGRGIGRRAVAILEQALAASGSAGMHLQVSPQNAFALAFYAALGFSALGGEGLPEDFVYVGKRFA